MSETEQNHETAEGVGIVGGGGASTVEEARRLHHLATADPEPERDGLLTGPAHEAKYGLDRAEDSAERWRAAGVHPTENRALQPGDEGYVDPADTADQIGTDVPVVLGENNPQPAGDPSAAGAGEADDSGNKTAGKHS